MTDAARARRQEWQTRKSRLGDADEAHHDAAFWLQIPVAERTEAAWCLSEELWSLLPEAMSDEPGLSRSVARVIRP